MPSICKYTPAQVAAAVAAVKAAGRPYQFAKVAKKLKPKVHPDSLRRWVRMNDQGETPHTRPGKRELLDELAALLRQHGPDLQQIRYNKLCPRPGQFRTYWASWRLFRADALKLVGMGATLADRDKRRYQDQIQALQKQVRAAEREANAAEDVRSAIFGLANQPIEQPDWTVPATPSASKPGIPILFASDFQWGEVIKANELDGINAFDKNIASTRYKRLIERTIDLCCHHMVNPDYPGIIYLRGGDMISGEIHQELRETNDLQAIPASLDLVAHEAAGIRMLAERFGRVWVISVPGNHGRTTIKPHSKSYVETNYDYLTACMLEREFAGDQRVTFRTPMSGDARFAVFGWWFLLTHGDRIGSSGGQGFIGPAATIARGMKKLSDYYSTLGQHVDWTLVGHFHTPLELEHGWSNGSLPGYSEYAKTFRMRPQPPSQWLFFVHPRHGVTCRWPILLGARPKMFPHAPAVHLT